MYSLPFYSRTDLSGLYQNDFFLHRNWDDLREPAISDNRPTATGKNGLNNQPPFYPYRPCVRMWLPWVFSIGQSVCQAFRRRKERVFHTSASRVRPTSRCNTTAVLSVEASISAIRSGFSSWRPAHHDWHCQESYPHGSATLAGTFHIALFCSADLSRSIVPRDSSGITCIH